MVEGHDFDAARMQEQIELSFPVAALSGFQDDVRFQGVERSDEFLFPGGEPFRVGGGGGVRERSQGRRLLIKSSILLFNTGIFFIPDMKKKLHIRVHDIRPLARCAVRYTGSTIPE